MKSLILIFLSFISIPIFSQKIIQGSYSVLCDEETVCVKWDFSNTTFEKKYNEKAWIAQLGTEEWEKAKNEAMAVILRCANEKLKTKKLYLVLDSLVEHNYTISICPVKLDRKGNNVTDYILLDRQNTEIAKIQIKGDGGHWGSLGNLLGDGYEEAAEKLGNYLKKQVKR